MLKFLNIDKFSSGLLSVTTPEMFTKTGEPHSQGLFSEAIFGPIGSLERKQKYSYIDLNSKIVHPEAYRIFIQLDRRIQGFLSAENLFVLDDSGKLVESEEGTTGISEFIKLFPKISFRGETYERDRLIKVLKEAYITGTLFVSKVPVIPPDLRPAYQDTKGTMIIDPLNTYYLTVLKRSFQVRSTGSAGMFSDLLKWGLQTAVNECDSFVRTKMGHKSGAIRSQLLAKRVDFSGRAVITPNPNLKVNEIGIPLKLAVSLFEPFLLHILIYSNKVDAKELEKEVDGFLHTSVSVDSIKNVIKSIKAGHEIPKRLYDIFFEATELAMTGRVVIAKRDPDLHPESIRAFRPILTKGNSMEICTLQVGGFNADFDGDTMGVYHPLTNEAQEEAKQKMMRPQTGLNSDSIAFELSKEMCVGLYLITKPVRPKNSPIHVSEEDLEKASDPYIAVVYRGKNTTMGKAIVNSCFPNDFPFIDDILTRNFSNSLIHTVLEKYGDRQCEETASKLSKIGFKFATIISPTIRLSDLEIPDEIYKLKEKMKGASIEQTNVLLMRMKKILIEHLKDTGLYNLVESGTGKGWDQPMQILVSKGIIADPKGNLLEPIKGSFAEGLSTTEFFRAAPSARKGMIDKVINTSETGYLFRKMLYFLSVVELDPFVKDCRTKQTLSLVLDDDLSRRLHGRFIEKDRKVIEFDPHEFKSGSHIDLRTPIYCKSPKICHICYGRLVERHRTPYIGVLAAQTIGEIGTQFTMRSFHVGGVKLAERNLLKEISDNDPTIHEDKLATLLSQEDNRLVALKDCKVIIDLSQYDVGRDIEFNEDLIEVRSLISQIEIEDVIFYLILDFRCNLFVEKKIEIGEEKIELLFKRNSTILEVPTETIEMKEQVNYVERLLSGREIFKDVEHLYRKLYKVYAPLRVMDSVHLEIVISQALRDKERPSLPARLGRTWNPELVNIRKTIFASGFLQGLAFENINQAIKTGLISEEKLPISIIEKLMTENLVKAKG